MRVWLVSSLLSVTCVSEEEVGVEAATGHKCPLPVSSVKALTTNAFLPTTPCGRCPFYTETEAHRGDIISLRSQGWE